VSERVGQNGLPLPRSLATIGHVRREIVSLYRQTKGGLIDAQLAGRLSHMLQLLTSIMRDHDLEERLLRLEQHLDIAARRPRPNGKHADARH